MAVFRSATRNLTLQDEDGIWAEFVDHEFETSDKKVIARLAASDGIFGREPGLEPDAESVDGG